jgi:hypothetical protein
MARPAAATVIAIVIVACSSIAACSSPGASGTTQPATTVTQPRGSSAATAPTASSAGATTVAGDKATGASDPIALPGGSYTVEWGTSGVKLGCTFHLVLETTIGVPTGMEVPQQTLAGAAEFGGTVEWADVPPGTYLVQEDRSLPLDCAGPWTITLTAH